MVTMTFPSVTIRTLIDPTFEFTIETMRNIVESVGFPMFETGPITLTLLLNGNAVATYPLSVKHQTAPDLTATPSWDMRKLPSRCMRGLKRLNVLEKRSRR